jgi:hypothetical protein
MSRECVSDCCLSRIVVHVPWVCEWLLLISNCNSCPVQSLTHSRDMNYNSRLTAITHTLTGHDLQFEINSNHSHTHGTWTTIRDKQQSLTLSRDMIYNLRLTAITHTLTGHDLQFEINTNHSHTHGTWTTTRDKQQFISNCSSCHVIVWVIDVYLEL